MMRSFRERVFQISNFFRNSFCPCCGSKGISFYPLPAFYQENAIKYGYKYFGKGEMTALSTYFCSSCSASDRERLYAFWLLKEIASNKLNKNDKFIHFAPERSLSSLIRSLGFQYITVDLLMEEVDQQEDLMSLSFQNDSFDFFICSHVLEHVSDDEKAIQEIFRILKPGGRGILMSPIIVDLPLTLENPLIESEEERWKYFGQGDHLRLYSHNGFVERITRNGFLLTQLDINYFGKKIFKRLGLKETSILYVVEKP